MSSIIKPLELFYLEGSNPRIYSLLVEINQESTHSYLIPNTCTFDRSNESVRLIVKLDLTDSEPGVLSKKFNLGPIEFASGESKVDVEINHKNGTEPKSIRVKEAQQESRPIFSHSETHLKS